jgi:hypothetical protein
MKHLKKFNESSENTKSELYLIQEDGGDCLYFAGLYNNLDTFIYDMKEKISKDENIDISEIETEVSDTEILFNYMYSKDIFDYRKISINELVNY